MSYTHARTAGALLAAALTITVLACGAMEDAAGMSDRAADDDDGEGGAGATDPGPPPANDAGVDAPPEQELESSFSSPVATGNYVWITNPTSGRVAYIHAQTLEIEVVDAGHAPTYLAAVPDEDDDVAIVLNVLSQDATVLRASSGILTTTTLPVPSTGNAWAIAASGRWATAWTDWRAIDDPDPIDGFQDISVLDLSQDDEQSTALTVGYRPVALAYDDQGSRLFAVTEVGVSVVALDGPAPSVIANVALSDDPFEDTSSRDVAITSDGAYALVRRDYDEIVNVVSLEDGELIDVVLPAAPTDLDLAPDGSVAVAVLRDTSQVALLRLPDIADDPESFDIVQVESVVIGSVSLASDSSMAFLYTNAIESPALTVLDTAEPEPEPRNIALHASVQAVFPTPDGSHAVVLHQPGVSEYPAAFSVVPIAELLPSRIAGLNAPIASVAVAPSGERVLVAVGSETDPDYGLVVAHMPSLQVDRHLLASKPIAAGIVDGPGRGYAAQEHPDGRITFVDFDSGDVRTITGFELASQVENGS